MNNLFQVLWLCITLGVLWIGVFSVLKGDDILSWGSNGIKDYGKSLGKLALKAPLGGRVVPGVSMTPLQAFRQFHPKTIDYNISSSGWAGWLEQMKNSGKSTGTSMPPTEPAARGELAKKIVVDKELKGHIELHIKNIKGGNDPKALFDLLKKEGYTGLTEANLVQKLLELKKDVAANGGTLEGLEKENVETIEKELKKREDKKKP